MAERYGTIQVKMSRGGLVLSGMGRTGRGQRYVKRTVKLESEHMSSKKFKSELPGAVAKLFDSEA